MQLNIDDDKAVQEVKLPIVSSSQSPKSATSKLLPPMLMTCYGTPNYTPSHRSPQKKALDLSLFDRLARPRKNARPPSPPRTLNLRTIKPLPNDFLERLNVSTKLKQQNRDPPPKPVHKPRTPAPVDYFEKLATPRKRGDEILIDSIHMEGKTKSRGKINMEHIERLATPKFKVVWLKGMKPQTAGHRKELEELIYKDGGNEALINIATSEDKEDVRSNISENTVAQEME
jgi:hypothetical protein